MKLRVTTLGILSLTGSTPCYDVYTHNGGR